MFFEIVFKPQVLLLSSYVFSDWPKTYNILKAFWCNCHVNRWIGKLVVSCVVFCVSSTLWFCQPRNTTLSIFHSYILMNIKIHFPVFFEQVCICCGSYGLVLQYSPYLLSPNSCSTWLFHTYSVSVRLNVLLLFLKCFFFHRKQVACLLMIKSLTDFFHYFSKNYKHVLKFMFLNIF